MKTSYNVRPITAMVLAAVIIMVSVMIAVTAIPSHAGTQQLDFTVGDMATALDKNGNEYVRFIVPITKEWKGHVFEFGVPAMAFGKLVPQAKEFSPGDEVSAIVNYRKLSDGRESYTILKFLMTDD